MNDILISPEDVAVRQQRFITKVYGWMALALAITAISAFYTISTEAVLRFVFANRFVFFAMIIGELLLVGFISRRINSLSTTMATVLFVLYSVLNGMTLSGIFLMYTLESIATTFFIAGGIFAVMSLYGWFTGNDLTKMGSLLFMALIGVLIASVVNIFMGSTMLYWIITYVGIFVFVGLIAYDTQKLKDMSISIADDQAVQKKTAILGALSLYLDFINLFIMLLRIFGSRR